MRKMGNRGFTLVEVVVVVAVIAILAAVLTPYISKYIDDSKIAKARNECQVVAAAVANYYKDTGLWPHNPYNNVQVALFYTVGSAAGGAPNSYGNFVNGAGAGAGWNVANVARIDTFFGTAAPAGIPTTGEMAWKGPYAATPMPLDPWGRPYLIYVPATATANGPIWVMSGGPNQQINTAATATAVTGDDVGVRVR